VPGCDSFIGFILNLSRHGFRSPLKLVAGWGVLHIQEALRWFETNPSLYGQSVTSLLRGPEYHIQCNTQKVGHCPVKNEEGAYISISQNSNGIVIYQNMMRY
jgi:hypothetical protein